MQHHTTQRIKAKTPELLDRLAALTAHRERALLETSLVGAVTDVFGPCTCRVIALDGDGRPGPATGSAREDACRADALRFAPAISEAIQMARTNRRRVSTRVGSDAWVTVLPVLQLRGVATLLVIETARELPAPELALIDGMARVYRNFCGLIDEAAHDQLTGLLNRRTFDECIDRLISPGTTALRRESDDRRKVPKSPSHWLSMIDIDHFKLVNDNFGHLYGDEVLLLIAGIMKRCFRSGDALFRFGGEEFVVIIADASRDQACVAFERFRTMVENYNFPQVGRVTVSFGAVEAHPGIDPTTLLGRADQALYFAKEHGRNRVVFWEDLPRRGQPREAAAAGSVDLF